MASKIFLVDIDLQYNQLKKSLLEQVTTLQKNALTGADLVEGRIIYDKDVDEAYFYDGSAWIAFGGDIRSVAEATDGGIIVTNGGGPNVTLALRVDGSSLWVDTTDDTLKVKDNGIVTSHILNNNVTLAKLEKIGTLTVLGNLSAAEADVAEVTVEDSVAGLSSLDNAMATSKAILEAIATAITNGMDYKGGYDAATNTPDLDVTPIATAIGDTYTVTAAGDFFSQTVEAGDMLISEATNPTTEAEWTVVQKNVGQATETEMGIAQIATTAEAETGTNDTDIMTPLKVKHVIDYHIQNYGVVSIASGTLTGDGATTAFTLTHNFGTNDVITQVRTSAGEVVEIKEDLSSTNIVRFTFNTAPASLTDYRATVVAYNTNITA